MSDYDVSRIFKRIEMLLIESMIRNLKKHRAQGGNWEQWQKTQLRELERYRRQNRHRFTKDFKEANRIVAEAFRLAYGNGAKNTAMTLGDVSTGFFGINDKKLDALIEATTADFEDGEQSLLRRASDIYRKVIFDAQMYASMGGSYEQAVDMATKDFLKRSIDTIQYKGWTDKDGKKHKGAVHTMSDYASMAIRTGQKRAYLMGEGKMRQRYGVHTVRVNNRHEKPCPLCIKWMGHVLVDDVYSGGTEKEAKEKKLPTLSQAMAMGFLHPNCKDTLSTYVEGISRPAKKWTKKELQEIADAYNDEQRAKHAEDMAESYERMARFSLDPINHKQYKERARAWRERVEELKDSYVDTIDTETVVNNVVKIASKDEVKELLEQMDDHEREVWLDAINTVPIEYTVALGSECYNPLLGKVYLNTNSNVKAFFHELGHAIDYKNRRLIEIELGDGKEHVSPSGVIDTTADAETIYSEIISFFGYETNSRGRIVGMSNSRSAEGAVKYGANKLKFESWVLKAYDDGVEPWAVSLLADCIEAITEGDVGEYSMVGGHSRQYWQEQSFWSTSDYEIASEGVGTRGTRELFAQYCSLMAMGRDDLIEMLREISPTLIDELEYSYGEVFYA